jgi:uncharacterized protein (TIGR03545 family)/uncharacterized protein (TIGR03546 family)
MLTLLYKILKALNSSQKEYQLALALVLALFSGLLPFFSLLNLVILFFVFTINIPIGLYGALALIFSLIGSILDPLLHDFGHSILTNPSLESFFTTLYNTPIALWFDFNHTITMGGLVASLVLAIPAYFISKKLFKSYRTILEKYFKNIKFLAWLNPYSESKTTKKQPFIRWWGSGLFIAFTGLCVAFFLLLFDPIVKKTIEFSVSKATKGEFIINDFSTSISDTNLIMKNIVFTKKDESHTIDEIIIDLDTHNLLREKVDIKDFIIKNLHLNQKKIEIVQETDTQKKEETKKEESFKLDLNVPNIDDLLAKEDLKSVSEAKEIKKRYKDIQVYWKKAQKEKLQKSRLENIQKQYKEIEKLSKNIKSLDDINLIVQKSKSLKKEIDLLKKDYKELKAQYKKDQKTLKDDFALIKTLPKKDYEYLVNKYQFNTEGALNVVETYISDDVAEYSRLALEYYNLLKPYLPKSPEEELNIVRKKGAWIKYTEYNPYPDFVIQNFYMNLVNSKAKEVALKGSYFEKLDITFIADSFKQKKFKIADNIYLDSSIINFDTHIVLDDYRFANVDSIANFTHADFEYKKANSKSEKIVKSILDDIHTFYISSKGKLDIKSEDLGKLNVKSDLDKKLKTAFNKELKNQTKIYKEKLKSRLKDELKKNIGDMSDKDFKKLEKILDSQELQNGDFSKLLDKHFSKKQLQKKLEDKLKAKAKAKKDAELKKLKEKAKKEKAEKERKLKEKAKKEKEKAEEKLKNKLKSLF